MFSEQQYKGIKLLAFDPWWQEGFVHGFIGRQEADRQVFSSFNSPPTLTKAGGSDLSGLNLICPIQSHGNVIAKIVKDELQPGNADAIFAHKCEGKNLTFAVRTADCLPIIVRSQSSVALIHAGWRGLANGIIAKTLEQFSNENGIHAVIGPAAGTENYQVGREVIDAIGETAIYLMQEDKIYLSLAKTAAKQLAAYEIFDVDICTIASPDWHSYRRDGEKRGSNYAFVVL